MLFRSISDVDPSLLGGTKNDPPPTYTRKNVFSFPDERLGVLTKGKWPIMEVINVEQQAEWQKNAAACRQQQQGKTPAGGAVSCPQYEWTVPLSLESESKDAATGIINKLETYNGCILADSVGLGKTFTALAVVKYYELRNKSVLVLCPKKLADNWRNYNSNLTTNIFAKDRDRKSTRLNSSHSQQSRMPSSA